MLPDMTKKVLGVAAIAAMFCLTNQSIAQSWSVSAAAPQSGTISSSVLLADGNNAFDLATVPVGPVAPGLIDTAVVALQGHSASASASWAASVPGQAAPVAFRISSVLEKQFPVDAGMSLAGAGVSLVLDLTITSPSPVTGGLQLQLDGLVGAFTEELLVDVGADGVTDWTAGVSPNGAMLPLSIPAGGAVVRVTYLFNFAFGNPGVLTRVHDLQAQFFPGETICEPYDFTGAGVPLDVAPQGNDVYDLVLQPVNGTTPLLMAFGYQDVVAPLWPGVTVLCSLDVLVAAGPGGVTTLAMPPLPPGYELFAQGLSIDGNGDLLSSNSVRALVLP